MTQAHLFDSIGNVNLLLLPHRFTLPSDSYQSRRHFSGEVLQWKSLRERSYGVLERRPNTELKEAAAAAGVDVMRYTPEGGETLDQMFARIKVRHPCVRK